MDGWEFARELRARFARAAPIAVVSATLAAQRAAEVGAVDAIG